MAPTKRSPGSALALRCERQRRISTKATIDSTALSANTYGAAGAGQQRAGHHRADDARHVHRDAVERQRRGQFVARHHLGHDGGEHRPAHRHADAVGEGQRQQQRRRQRIGQRQRAQHHGHAAPPTAAWRRSSAAGRRCRPARRWAGRARTPAAWTRPAPAPPSPGCRSARSSARPPRRRSSTSSCWRPARPATACGTPARFSGARRRTGARLLLIAAQAYGDAKRQTPPQRGFVGAGKLKLGSVILEGFFALVLDRRQHHDRRSSAPPRPAGRPTAAA